MEKGNDEAQEVMKNNGAQVAPHSKETVLVWCQKCAVPLTAGDLRWFNTKPQRQSHWFYRSTETRVCVWKHFDSFCFLAKKQRPHKMENNGRRKAGSLNFQGWCTLVISSHMSKRNLTPQHSSDKVLVIVMQPCQLCTGVKITPGSEQHKQFEIRNLPCVYTHLQWQPFRTAIKHFCFKVPD